jgi:YjbE family integral membrane protein
MGSILVFMTGAFQITLLDIVLSGDNIGIIALATKNLNEVYAKRAAIIGVFGAISLRILFTCLITYILMVQWLPIKLLGGMLLMKITWDFIKPESKGSSKELNISNNFMGAIKSIIIADATMSLDNVIAIAAAADGQFFLIVFGLLLNIPIIFFGSQIAAKLMNKHPIAVYIGGAILAHTSVKMILEDNLIIGFIPYSVFIILPIIAAAVVLIYGLNIIGEELHQNSKTLKKHT